MKSLQERQEQRKAARELALKGSPNQDTGIIVDKKNDDESKSGEFDKFTIEQLRAVAAEMGTEVPKEKTKHADILEFVNNLAAFKKAEGGDNSSTGWKSGN